MVCSSISKEHRYSQELLWMTKPLLATMKSFHQGNSEEESSHEVGTPRNKQENTSLQRWRVSIKGTLKKTVPMTWELTCEDNDRSAQIAGFCLRQPEGTVWGSDCHASSNGPIDSRSWPSSNQSHMWRKYNLGIKQRAFWTQTKDATAQDKWTIKPNE